VRDCCRQKISGIKAVAIPIDGSGIGGRRS
jgi:hypothetical protein